MPRGFTSVITGFPSVMVPVLSITTVSILWAISRASPDLINMPFSAPLPVPTIMATGVAKPKAHGQEITRMDITMEKTNSTLAPIISQIRPAVQAIIITTGTKIPAILSAMRAIGALDALASSTSLIIWLMVVSSPTRKALNFIKPFLLMVAEITLSPTVFSTGILSPEIADSSILVEPSVITPSTGILSPGRTTTISPIARLSTATSSSAPSFITVACFGAKSMSFSRARLVCPLARASKYFPRVIRVTIMPADSKYKLVLYSFTNAKSPCPSPYPMRKMAKAPNRADAIEPIPTRVSIFGAPWTMVRKPTI